MDKENKRSSLAITGVILFVFSVSLLSFFLAHVFSIFALSSIAESQKQMVGGLKEAVMGVKEVAEHLGKFSEINETIITINESLTETISVLKGGNEGLNGAIAAQGETLKRLKKQDLSIERLNKHLKVADEKLTQSISLNKETLKLSLAAGDRVGSLVEFISSSEESLKGVNDAISALWK